MVIELGSTRPIERKGATEHVRELCRQRLRAPRVVHCWRWPAGDCWRWPVGAPLSATAQPPPQTAAATPDAALSLLTEGNARYVANQPRQRDFSAARANTELGQAPFAAILSCSDSRVAPELAFDQNPG